MNSPCVSYLVQVVDKGSRLTPEVQSTNSFLIINRWRCYEEICIGDNTGISWESQIFDTNFHYMLSSTRSVKPINKAVRIGSHCWIGNRVTIMKGTLLPDGAIVASNSFVNKSFSDFFRPLVAGSPALLIRQGDLAIFDFAVQAKLNNFFQNTQQQEYVISDDEITQIMNI